MRSGENITWEIGGEITRARRIYFAGAHRSRAAFCADKTLAAGSKWQFRASLRPLAEQRGITCAALAAAWAMGCRPARQGEARVRAPRGAHRRVPPSPGGSR